MCEVKYNHTHTWLHTRRDWSSSLPKASEFCRKENSTLKKESYIEIFLSHVHNVYHNPGISPLPTFPPFIFNPRRTSLQSHWKPLICIQGTRLHDGILPAVTELIVHGLQCPVIYEPWFQRVGELRGKEWVVLPGWKGRCVITYLNATCTRMCVEWILN